MRGSGAADSPRLAERSTRRVSAHSAPSDDRTLLDVAVAGGVASVDAGALNDAEARLRSALAAARASDEQVRAAEACGALMRVLFWQGRFDEAADLASAQDRGAADREIVLLSAAATRVAVGREAPGGGLADAARAVAAAERVGSPLLLAQAACAAAFAHLAADDHAAALRDADRCVLAARAAHDPLRALRARLLAAEAHRREGRPAPAVRLLARVVRLPRGALPATVQARVTLLRDLLAGADPRAAAERIVSASGLRALTLYAPGAHEARREGRPVLNEVLDLLGGAQSADDDGAALAAVCASLRAQLRAAAVSFVTLQAGRPVTLAADGARVDAALAQRVLAAGQPVRLQPQASGAEAGAPVRYGGRSLGAIVARWSAGAFVDAARVTSLLTIGAAVGAPALAAVAGQLSRPMVAPDDIVGVSDTIMLVRRAVERAAPAPYPVLIEGESGSGKELVARAVHRRGPRRDRAFCAVNCAALPDDLLEAELFGHARGAFTGAVAERPGVFEEAHGGTLFLDEVGELSPRAQAKLLRTVQEGEVRRVGENISRRVDVRVVAATNRNLRQDVAQGRFRLDLLYRLDVVRIAVPPLRERSDDIPMLVERFWREATTRVHSQAVLSSATVAALARYAWPGNVRELQNVLAALAVRAPRRGVVTPAALPPPIGGAAPEPRLRLDEARRCFDDQFVRSALVRTGGHRGKAADELGLSRQGLTKLMTRLRIGDEHPAI